jgi:hypothetical protein
MIVHMTQIPLFSAHLATNQATLGVGVEFFSYLPSCGNIADGVFCLVTLKETVG